MKTIIVISAVLFASINAFSQDTTFQKKDHVRLQQTNPAMTIAPTAGVPDQGGDMENEKWFKVDSSDKASYCVITAAGQLKLQKNGKDVKKGIILMDGTRISLTGYVKRKNGNVQMKSGECITRDGLVKAK